VAAARQRGQDLFREGGRIAVMKCHPVALARERLGHRPADSPGSPGHQDGSLGHDAPY
jgi:hypothetical protein